MHEYIHPDTNISGYIHIYMYVYIHTLVHVFKVN